MEFVDRVSDPRYVWLLEQAGVHPLLAGLFAARGVRSEGELSCDLGLLLPPDSLAGMDGATALLVEALRGGLKVCFVADYDCDGATACAVGLRGLRMLGFGAEQLCYVVPDRMVDGYGLTPAIAERVKVTGADVLVTVDNGVASLAGVAHAHGLGLKVLVTDHHLPAVVDGVVQLPEADAIVNPNQPTCSFASKALAGVGVVFYVLIALRSRLRAEGFFEQCAQPRLDALLDLVALGTVVDVVRLDENNRRLVEQGLVRMRKGYMQPGVAALFEVALRDARVACAADLGFALGPRLNAAGRLSDMGLGIECLLTDDVVQARVLAEKLDAMNRERKEIEQGMLEQSLVLLEQHLSLEVVVDEAVALPVAMCIYDEGFHEGVIGILASRIKERLHRPVFVFAPASGDENKGLVKGSGRSIEGLHLRDALDLVEKRQPGMLLRFGGHAMAAGCTLYERDLEAFSTVFSEVVTELIDAHVLERRLETDGALKPEFCTPEVALLLKQTVWGSGFPPPVFRDRMKVLSQRIVGENHLSLKLAFHDRTVNGIWFRRTEPVPPVATLAYRLDVNEWRGIQSVQFVIEGMQTD